METRLLEQAAVGLTPAQVAFVHAVQVANRANALAKMVLVVIPGSEALQTGADLVLYPNFLQVWAWMQARAGRLSHEFPGALFPSAVRMVPGAIRLARLRRDQTHTGGVAAAPTRALGPRLRARGADPVPRVPRV